MTPRYTTILYLTITLVQSPNLVQVSTLLNQTNSNNNNHVDLQYNMMESWEPSDYLYYPVTPEMTVHDVPENPMTASFNIQSLFGFVVPQSGHSQ